MNLKKSEIVGLETVFNGLMEIRLKPDVAYKVASNAILANEFASRLRKAYKPVEGYEEIEKLRQKIFNDAGAIPSGNGTLTISPEKAVGVREKIDAFNEEHKDLIGAQDEYQKEFNELLEAEESIAFETIDRKDLTVEIEPSKIVLMIKTGVMTSGDKS